MNVADLVQLTPFMTSYVTALGALCLFITLNDPRRTRNTIVLAILKYGMMFNGHHMALHVM